MVNHFSILALRTPCKSESCSVMSDSLQSHGLDHGILQARILEWVVIPFYRESSPGIEPRSSTLQADSLPAESPGKPKLVVMVVKQHEWDFPGSPVVKTACFSG